MHHESVKPIVEDNDDPMPKIQSKLESEKFLMSHNYNIILSQIDRAKEKVDLEMFPNGTYMDPLTIIYTIQFESRYLHST